MLNMLATNPHLDPVESHLTHQRALDFVRWASCLYEKGIPARASERYLERWPRSLSAEIVTKSISLFEKAAVAPGTTADPEWAKPLVGVAKLAEAFVGLARSASLLGRIPNLRRAPFHVAVPVQTGGGSFYWVKQNTPKPITTFSFATNIILGPTKAAGIIVVTKEVATLAVPGTEAMLRDALIAGVTAFTDLAFLDPTSVNLPDQRPGSITSGVAAIPGTGDLVADVGTLLDAFYAARPGAVDAVLLMSPATAASLTGAEGTSTPYGLPLVRTEAAGPNVIVLDPHGVVYADDGINVDESREATIELVDNPSGGALTSAWQCNLAAFKVERFVNWQAVPNAVQYLTPAP